MANRNPNKSGLRPFPKGVSGNPGGRPAGARDRVTKAFLDALADDFKQHGPDTIERAREKDPVAYLRVCASLVPKELDVNHDASGTFLKILEAISRGDLPAEGDEWDSDAAPGSALN